MLIFKRKFRCLKVKEPLPPRVPSPWRIQVWNMYDNSEPEDVRGIKPFRIRMSSRWKNLFFCTFLSLFANALFKWPDFPKYSTWHSAVLWLDLQHLCACHRSHLLLDSNAYWSTCSHFTCLSKLVRYSFLILSLTIS